MINLGMEDAVVENPHFPASSVVARLFLPC
jgi:hypothetical protein